jgi:7-cyano-7-deazaguanine synthase
MPDALVVLSGGQDSTTCLYWAANQGFDNLHAVTFDYDQRHSAEIDAASAIVAQFSALGKSITHEIVKLGPILSGTSPLISSEPLEQYADHESLPGGLEKTFVPMRNQLFLTIAANRAYVRGIQNLVTGVCQEDSGGYPDCRQPFIDALEKSINLGTFTGEAGTIGNLRIHTPLMHLTKAESIDLACRLPGCYAALGLTHTAYDGAYPPIGKDHATLLREKGFAEAGLPDPLIMRAMREGLMPLPKADNYSPASVAEFHKLTGLPTTKAKVKRS